MSSLKHISTDTQTQIDLPWKLIRFGISAYDCECNFPFAQLYVANNSTQIACKNKLLHFAIYKFHIVGSISTCNNRWQHTHRWTLFTLEKLGLKQKKSSVERKRGETIEREVHIPEWQSRDRHRHTLQSPMHLPIVPLACLHYQPHSHSHYRFSSLWFKQQ